MQLSNKNHSPILALLTIPALFPLFLNLCRLYLKTISSNQKREKKGLLAIARFFQFEQQELVKLPEFKHISEKTRTRFLEQVQKSYRHQIDISSTVVQKRALNKTLNLIEQKQQLSISYSYPYRMYLEITRNCNLRCRVCCQSIVDIERNEIAPEIIQKIKPLIPYCESIAVYGFGESLTAPHFFEYL
jgi:hypothetical protein